MKILIMEDEEMAGRMLKNILVGLLGQKIESIQIQTSLVGSKCYMWEHPVDILFLDLDLHGEDGFEILKMAAAGSFHTIIVSAHTDRAVEAFEYGVLDFVAKPYTEERIRKALERYTEGLSNSRLKYLSIAREGRISLIPVEDVSHIEAVNKQTQIYRKDGHVETCNKMLQDLEKILPAHYMRIHRSYIANVGEIKEISKGSHRPFSLVMNNGDTLPISRVAYRFLKDRLDKAASE